MMHRFRGGRAPAVCMVVALGTLCALGVGARLGTTVDVLVPHRALTPYSRSMPTAVSWCGEQLLVADPNSTAEGTASLQAFVRARDQWRLLRWLGSLRRGKTTIPLAVPSALACTSAGVWVADSYAARVYVVGTPATGLGVCSRVVHLSPDAMMSVSDITPGPDGGVYVLAGARGALTGIRTGGEVSTTVVPQMAGAEGLCFRPATGRRPGAIFVACPYINCVKAVDVDASGRVLPSSVRTVAARLFQPVDVTCTDDGTIWVLEAASQRVTALGEAGETSIVADLRRLCGRTVRPWRLAVSGRNWLAITAPNDGKVYVVGRTPGEGPRVERPVARMRARPQA